MGNMTPANPKHSQICAFCSHWYDPTNSCIQPQSPNRWLYDRAAKRMCTQKSVEVPSWAGTSCKHYEGKV